MDHPIQLLFLSQGVSDGQALVVWEAGSSEGAFSSDTGLVLAQPQFPHLSNGDDGPGFLPGRTVVRDRLVPPWRCPQRCSWDVEMEESLPLPLPGWVRGDGGDLGNSLLSWSCGRP